MSELRDERDDLRLRVRELEHEREELRAKLEAAEKERDEARGAAVELYLFSTTGTETERTGECALMANGWLSKKGP